MKKLTARRLGIVAAFVILVGAFAGSSLLRQMKKPPPTKGFTPTTKQVETFSPEPQTVRLALDIQGTLRAYDKIDIFSEVNGTLLRTDRAFKEGVYFPKGATLIRVDDEEARLSILSQKSNLLNAITQIMPDLKVDYPQTFTAWDTYLNEFDLETSLTPLPEVEDKQARLFIASRNIYPTYYTIRSAEERLAKYEIKAPFNGVLTQTSINPGTLVRAGQKLGELMRTGSYELEATVPLRELQYLSVGNTVTLTSEDIAGSWTGKVRRISDQIDPETQTIRVFVEVSGQELREGMYLKGTVQGGAVNESFELPRSLLVDQKKVYVVRDGKLALETVEVVRLTAETAILKKVPTDAPLLANMLPGLFDGMEVKVRASNEVAPE
jgi:membrane fusion protein (multidrug efflux system)